MEEKQDKKWYTVQDAAARLGVHRITIIRWIKAGVLESERSSPAPQAPYLIPASEVNRYAERREAA